MLTGCMMDDYQLNLSYILERAGSLFAKNEIVTRNADGSLFRYTYGDYYERTKKLANALKGLGVREGDRVATLCWNHHRHLEAYLAIPSMGAVLHTLNLRLHPADLTYIARHAEDKVVIVDRSLLSLLEQFRAEVPSIRHVIVIPDDGPTPDGYLDYEQIVAEASAEFTPPRLDERSAAAMCYTSGTTGNPKGVMYSHRSTMLHTLGVTMADSLAVGESDAILPVVPMFHANAWGLPYAAVLTGAKMVFPGPNLQPDVLLDLMAREKVTVAAGVPTIWLGILALMDTNPGKWDLASVRTMVIGGSAAPPAMIDGFKKRHNLVVTHAWGMTEMSPIGSLARVKNHMADASHDEKLKVWSTQGFSVPLVEIRHVDDTGKILPWDGETMGELEVRGPWVAASYYNNTE